MTIELEGIKFKATFPFTEGECSAFRCKKPAIAFYPQGTGGAEEMATDVWLCSTHLKNHHKAAKKAGLETVPTAEPWPLEDEPRIDVASRTIEMPPEENTDQQALAVEAQEAKTALESIQDFEIQGQDDIDFLKDFAKEAATKRKELEERRKKATDPMRKALEEVRSWFKPAEGGYKELEAAAKRKVADYALAAAAEEARLLQEAEAAAESGDMGAVRGALVAAAESTVQVKGMRDNWKIRIVEAGAVPREYCIPDEKAILADVKAAKKAGREFSVSGVEIYNEPIVANT